MPTNSGGWYPRSFVLTDIVGSVSLWEREAELMAQAVALHDAIIGREVAAVGGTLVRRKGEGDSTFSVFAHPADAVAAAVAIQAAVGVEQWPTGERLQVRAGVHTGDAEPRNGDWYGPAVNRAARLRALANGGQTLLSGVTAGLVADQVPRDTRLLYRGRRVLRGIERPEEVWELVAADDPRLYTLKANRAGSLPVEQTRFVGRAVDLDHLPRLVEDERLVTLTGPGGSGKTRLAMELARDATRLGETVWLAELASLRDGGLVAQAVAMTVGLEAGPDPLDELLAQAEALAGMLVLDNCEHLLGDCAVLVERLLAAAPGVRVLATSREPLGLAGEQEWPVGPLDVPKTSLWDREQLARVDSVRLLLDRARAVRPTIEVSQDDVASVVSICRALDGIPLAVELAAGRLRSLSFADLANRLDDQLKVLTQRRAVGSDSRHRSLRMTLDWSYDLLTEAQQTLARHLSVFAGGFRLDAVEAVCGGKVDVLDGVDELVAKSLVTFDGTTARYRLLEPLRQYLAERLDESGETEAASRAHAQWVTGLCDQIGTRLLEDQRGRSIRLREETGNINLALRWAKVHGPALATRIVGALGQYWSFHDQASGRRWCDAIVNARAEVGPRTWARALLSAGMVAQNDQDWTRSSTLLREALAIYREQDAVSGQAASLFWLGRALVNRSDAEHGKDLGLEATRCFEEGLQLCTKRGNSVEVGWFRNWLSVQAYWNDDLDRSEQLASQVVEECTAAGTRHPIGQALCILAFIARRRGDNDVALSFLQEAAAVYRDLGDPWQLAGVLVDLAALEAAMRRGVQALHTLAESSQLDEQIGRLPGRSYRLAIAAVVHLARGQPAMSIAALGAYDAHAEAGAGWTRPAAMLGKRDPTQLRYVRAGIADDRAGDRLGVPPQEAGPYVGWLSEAVEETRNRLDPAEVAAAATAARRKTLDELLDELIIQPAVASVD